MKRTDKVVIKRKLDVLGIYQQIKSAKGYAATVLTDRVFDACDELDRISNELKKQPLPPRDINDCRIDLLIDNLAERLATAGWMVKKLDNFHKEIHKEANPKWYS